MGVVILQIGAVGLYKMIGSQQRAVSNLEDLRQISAIQRKVAEKMHCAQTLRYTTANIGSALACGAEYELKSKNGKKLHFGKGRNTWDVKGKCEDGELLIFIKSGPKRRKQFRQAWQETEYGKDIFRGASEFCKNYFSADEDKQVTWEMGGFYVVTQFDKICKHPNFLTNDCSCRSGYEPYFLIDFIDKDCETDFFIEGGFPKSDGQECGAEQYGCLRFF